MNRVTGDAEKVLGLAETFASQSGSLIDSVHLLAALAGVKDSYGGEILSRLGFTEEIARSYLISVSSQPLQPSLPSPIYNKILNYALIAAKNGGYEYIDTQHILLSLSYHKMSLAGKILNRHGINYQTILSIVNGMTYNGVGKREESPAPPSGGKMEKIEIKKADYRSDMEEILLENGIDLTLKAREGKLDSVIGREKEINRVIRILSRKYKNNPIILGEPGVGKTAIVEGLARRIVSGDVPETLKGKSIFSLNINSLVSGTRYRGELEDKIKNILAVIQNSGIILFIDEMHTVMTAGSSDGGLNIGNILKPVLVSGEMSTIGATTVAEYRQFIEKDPALERRFMTVYVEEPSVSGTIKILKGIKEKFETHHGIRISEEAIESAAELSARYISDRFLPDKAIDVLDEACSSAVNAGKRGSYTLLGEDVREIVAEATGIPVQSLSVDESERLVNMEKYLSERIVGQQEAVSAVAKAIKRSRSGLKDPSRPAGSFIFLGNTGVGKTETAKVLCEFLFGSRDALIRLDMSEYMEKISVSRLVGAPPGYVGYEEGGYLTEAVRRKPYSVVLLDEIEKAHRDVFNILLQVLDEGHLTDSKGRTTDFKNTIIIMTSNIGSEETAREKKVGFGNSDRAVDRKGREDAYFEAVKKSLKPEFINRIDDIIVFNCLTKENLRRIAYLLLERLKETLAAERNIHLEVPESALEYLADISFDETYGARPLRRIIETALEDKLSEVIIKYDLRDAILGVEVKNNGLNFINLGGL